MENKVPMRVIFGLLENGEPIAFLLDADTFTPEAIMTYMHVGQHGEASLEIFDTIDLALPFQYKELLDELENIVGYQVDDRTPMMINVAGRKGYYERKHRSRS
jgi:hypothetical protein